MSIGVAFPKPKDPSDSAWYVIRFAETLSSVLAPASITVSMPTDTQGWGAWTTPGDAAAATPLTATGTQLTADSLGVTFLLAGGAPATSYAITVRVLTVTGSTLYRSAILTVTGL